MVARQGMGKITPQAESGKHRHDGAWPCHTAWVVRETGQHQAVGRVVELQRDGVHSDVTLRTLQVSVITEYAFHCTTCKLIFINCCPNKKVDTVGTSNRSAHPYA